MGAGKGKTRRAQAAAAAGAGQLSLSSTSSTPPTTWFLTPPAPGDDEAARTRRLQEFFVRHVDYELVEGKEGVAAMLAALGERPEAPVVLDFETASKGYRYNRELSRYGYVRLIQVGWISPKTGFAQQWVVDCQKVDTKLLQGLFQDRKREKIVHWSKFEQDFAHARLGFGIYPVFDTAFAWQSIQKRFRLWLEDDEKNGNDVGRKKIEALVPGWEKHPASLAALCENILKLELPKEMQRSDWNGELSAEQLSYAAMDVAVPLPLVPYLREMA